MDCAGSDTFYDWCFMACTCKLGTEEGDGGGGGGEGGGNTQTTNKEHYVGGLLEQTAPVTW